MLHRKIAGSNFWTVALGENPYLGQRSHKLLRTLRDLDIGLR